MIRNRLLAGLVAGGVAVAVTACGSGTEPRLPDGAPVVEDVGDRAAVRPIQLVTKTQSEDPTRYEMARLIVDAWKGAGIQAELLPVGTAQLNSMTATSKEFDTYIISYDGIPERLDPDNFLARFTSQNATDSGSNMSMYTDDAYDEAYQRQISATEEADRVTAVHDAQRLLYEDLPIAPLVHPEVGAAYRADRWTGIEVTPSVPLFSTWNAIHAEPTGDAEELVIGTTIDPSTLNPVLATQNQDLQSLHLIYDRMLSFDPAGDLMGSAVESWDVSEQEIRLEVRPGATFTDGQPVTAEDVAFTLRYMKEQGAALFAPQLAVVDGVEVSGTDVVIILSQPSASFPATVLSNMPVLPQHIWEDFDDPAEATGEDLVGSGPFRFESRSRAEAIVFSRNEDYHTPAKVDGVRLLILGSFDAAAGALESGQIDVINQAETVASQYEQIEGAAGVEVVYSDSHGWRGLHYNMSKAPFDDHAFRAALTALIPVDDLIQIAHQGKAKPAGSVIAPNLAPWHDDSLAPFEADPQGAMAALTEGGYVYDQDGTLHLPAGAK